MDLTSFIFGFVAGLVFVCTTVLILGIYFFITYGKRAQERNEKNKKPELPKFKFWTE